MAELGARASAFTRFVVGGAPAAGGLTIAECHGRALVTLGGAATDHGFVSALRGVLGAELPGRTGQVAAARHGWTLALGPSEWLFVAPDRDGWAVERELTAALAPVGGQAVDVSHGRAALRLSGAPVRTVLAKGCPIDLHPRAFAAGSCAQTLFGKIGVLLHARDADAIELYVSRSYADALADGLLGAAREFGVAIAPPIG